MSPRGIVVLVGVSRFVSANAHSAISAYVGMYVAPAQRSKRMFPTVDSPAAIRNLLCASKVLVTEGTLGIMLFPRTGFNNT